MTSEEIKVALQDACKAGVDSADGLRMAYQGADLFLAQGANQEARECVGLAQRILDIHQMRLTAMQILLGRNDQAASGEGGDQVIVGTMTAVLGQLTDGTFLVEMEPRSAADGSGS